MRQVAESHGGSVHVESPEGGGARFVLALPGGAGVGGAVLPLERICEIQISVRVHR